MKISLLSSLTLLSLVGTFLEKCFLELRGVCPRRAYSVKKENDELQTTGVHFYVHYMLRVAFQFRACLCVSVCLLACVSVPLEVRREHQIPWRSNYRL